MSQGVWQQLEAGKGRKCCRLEPSEGTAALENLCLTSSLQNQDGVFMLL